MAGPLHITRRGLGALLAGSLVPYAPMMSAHASENHDSSGKAIRNAAAALLYGVRIDIRDRLSFPFSAPERHRWTYVPGSRPGVFLDDMSITERDLAMALLAASLSRSGYEKATGVMKLAAVLRETRSFGRGSGAYAFAVFGDPSAGGAWGWRVEGHHLSLHFTAIDDRIVSATPHCICADPTEVLDGQFAGLAPLDREGYMGRDLARNLNDRQMARARRSGDVPNDIRAAPRRAELATDPGGIMFAELTDETQRHLILGLVDNYFSNLPRELAKAHLARLDGPVRDALSFQWIGGFEVMDLHYYRVHGPGLSIEYSTRERVSHVHTLWREPGNDFGREALAAAGHTALPPNSA